MTVRSRYVDVDTGEEITWREAREKYIVLNNKKNVLRNEKSRQWYVEWTKECRRSTQGRLF